MDWKKELNRALRNIYAWDYRNDSESNLRDELTDSQFGQIEAFIQSLLEEIAQKAIREKVGLDYEDFEHAVNTGRYDRVYEYGIGIGRSQHRQEVIDTFKEYGIIIK